jgi:hypothetical protein
MSRQAIRDSRYNAIGYIEALGDGRQKALDARDNTLGYFDPKWNETTDSRYPLLARCNVLSGLIYDRR